MRGDFEGAGFSPFSLTLEVFARFVRSGPMLGPPFQHWPPLLDRTARTLAGPLPGGPALSCDVNFSHGVGFGLD